VKVVHAADDAARGLDVDEVAEAVGSAGKTALVLVDVSRYDSRISHLLSANYKTVEGNLMTSINSNRSVYLEEDRVSTWVRLADKSVQFGGPADDFTFLAVTAEPAATLSGPSPPVDRELLTRCCLVYFKRNLFPLY